MKDITFITGNPHKAAYFTKLMELPIIYRKVELDELQSMDLHEIVEHKVRQAYDVIRGPVLVEDVSLEFSALGGLPGPFIKFFLENAGLEVCCKMVDNFTDRTASIRCTFGYYDGEDVKFFDAVSTGRVSDIPKGSTGYGFDKIFIADGYDITRAEMDKETNEATYRDQMKPFAAVKEFLTKL